MRPGRDALNMQKRVVLTIVVLILLPFASADIDIPDESREVSGGHAILLEQYTATWCDTCATIDPWISDFVDDRSNRVVRVALHPNDEDPFGTPLTSKRLVLKESDHQLSLPTFWFDGQEEVEGHVSQSTLESRLRNAEANRENSISMHMVWNTWGNEPHDSVHELTIVIEEDMPSNASITVFRLETLEMDSQIIAYNGIDIHHDVATQMITFNGNGTISESFDGAHGWNIRSINQTNSESSLVLTLETYGNIDGFVTEIEVDGSVRGVIGITDEVNPRNVEKDSSLTLILLVGA